MDALLPTQTAPALPTTLADGSARLVAAFLAGRSADTLRAYRQDLADFRAFAGAETTEGAARQLLAHGSGRANELALAYKADLQERGLAAATVNRRLAALRSLVKLARTLGLVEWTLEVRNGKAQAYRDTRGPGREGFERLLQALEGRQDAKGLRDRAIVRLLFDLGLRRSEAVGLDCEHVDLEARTVAVRGKGRADREPLTLPPETTAALKAWLSADGNGGPFHQFRPGRQGGPADGDRPLLRAPKPWDSGGGYRPAPRLTPCRCDGGP